METQSYNKAFKRQQRATEIYTFALARLKQRLNGKIVECHYMNQKQNYLIVIKTVITIMCVLHQNAAG